MKMMIDIETLSTNKDAAVISIGYVTFDDDKIIDANGWALDLAKVTGHINPATLKWWMNQSDMARAYSFGGIAKPADVATVLAIKLTQVTELWACDPDFDAVILENWFARTDGGRWPVSYRNYRSVRTIMQLAKDARINLDGSWNNGTAHNPVDDAANQARAVIAARKGLLNPVPVSRGWVPEVSRAV